MRTLFKPRPAVALLAALSLAGCAVGPDFHRPEPPDVGRYTSEPLAPETVSAKGHGGHAQHLVESAQIQRDWWRLFHSDKLDSLIARALRDSPTLESAQARLKQAEENLTAVKGGLYPQVDAQFGVTRQKFSGAQFGGVAGGSNIFNLYSGALNVSYNADVFGGVRRGVEAQRAQVDMQRYQLQATYLTLIGNLVGTAISAASFKAQIKATENVIQAEVRQLDLVRDQERAGAVPYSDVLQAQAQLAATRTNIAPLRQQLSVAEHQLAILAGSLPGNWTPADFRVENLTLPGELPLTVPSQLVRRRPDILAAESALHAASAQVGIATANEYPQINLSGSYGSQATDIGDLFDAPSIIWNIGASLLAPIFHGGALHAKKRAAVAAFKATAADYRETVLTAFAQVADVLRALQNDAASLKAQQIARDTAQQSLNLARTQYKAGAASYINVLTAEQQYERAQLGYVQALARRYQDTAALFNAMGGGWWNNRDVAQTAQGRAAADVAGEHEQGNTESTEIHHG